MPVLTNVVPTGAARGRVVGTTILLQLLVLTACDPERAPDVAGPPADPETWGLNADVATSPTNGKIVFVSTRDGTAELYTIESDGSGETRLTNDAAAALEPAWSPDGTKIAYVQYTGTTSDIVVINADGSGQTTLSGGHFDAGPAWSPDGAKLAFSSTDLVTGEMDIYVMNADGSDRTRLTTAQGPDLLPNWSPDGTRIVFLSLRGPSSISTDPTEIYVMNADGTDQLNLTHNSTYDVDPRWSPDGTKIVYIHGNTEASADYEVFVMNADGSGQTNLTNNTVQEDQPAWSPDGTRLVFSSQRSGSQQLWVMNADGSGPLQVTDLPANGNTSPHWQPIPPLPFAGFFAPVDNPLTVNVAKAGRGIPVKFSLGGDEGLAIFRAGFPKFIAAPCDPSDHQDPLEATTDSPSGLTYDPGSGQYTYVWKTSSGLAGRCGALQLGLIDGSNHEALFRFTR